MNGLRIPFLYIRRLGMKVKIEVEGKIIERVVKFEQLGNFVMNIVRYKNERYLVGDGDEYLRGYDKVFKLGRKIS